MSQAAGMLTLNHKRRITLALVFASAVILLLLKFRSTISVACIPIRTFKNSIANETLGFQKILMVNAPWRTDRKDTMTLAASCSMVELEWVDGVAADTIQEKAYPPGNHRRMSHGNLGSWRAHMNAMRRVVAQNLTTALILEDDVDWDIRLRTQLLTFAHAARTFPSITDRTKQQSKPPTSETKDRDPVDLAKISTVELPLKYAHQVPSHPYGSEWDVLWLGHCGTSLPQPSPLHPDRLMLLNDPTTPAPKHLRLREAAPPDPIATLYPPHTRVYHRTGNETLCTLAYAVTQRGARKILYELGVRELNGGFDFELGKWCGKANAREEVTRKEGEKPLERKMDCLTVQPPLFSHYWGEKGESDIMGVGIGGRPEIGSRYIMRSVRGNLEGLVEGSGRLFEQWTSDD